MKLWAIGDLHVGYKENREALSSIGNHADDWLILAGDVGEAPSHLDYVLKTVVPRFRQVVWVPGNHELWTPASIAEEKRGVAHYERLVDRCRRYGVLTPEDPWAEWPGEGPRRAIIPMFLLFDYTFAPDLVSPERAVAWAAEDGIRSVDEELLSPHPFASRGDWCHARVAATEERLEALPRDARLILANHYPLRRDLAVLPRVPRFSIWCGTRRTEDWHRRYNVEAVVYGHLHLRSSKTIDGVRFEEVSLGYPKQWNRGRGVDSYLRRIL